LGPKFGNTYSEYLIDLKTGDVRLVETAVRGCGNFTSSDLVPLACGIDVTALLIAISSGVTGVKIDQEQRISKASGSVFFHLPGGTICDILIVS
jgi:biotin carboxylase